MSLLIRSGLILTMNERFDLVEGDLSIRDGRISHVREYFNPVIAAYAFKRKIANAFLVEAL